jgi:hypothetical protein
MDTARPALFLLQWEGILATGRELLVVWTANYSIIEPIRKCRRTFQTRRDYRGRFC